MDWVKSGPFVDVVPDNIRFKGVPGLHIPDNSRFRSWLNKNVSIETHNWVQQSKRDKQGFVAYRYRFKNDDDAVMFKLTFNDSIHV